MKKAILEKFDGTVIPVLVTASTDTIEAAASPVRVGGFFACGGRIRGFHSNPHQPGGEFSTDNCRFMHRCCFLQTP